MTKCCYCDADCGDSEFPMCENCYGVLDSKDVLIADLKAEVERLKRESAEAFARYIRDGGGVVTYEIEIDGVVSGHSFSGAMSLLDDFRAFFEVKESTTNSD